MLGNIFTPVRVKFFAGAHVMNVKLKSDEQTSRTWF
jgi:hypothetical protein